MTSRAAAEKEAVQETQWPPPGERLTGADGLPAFAAVVSRLPVRQAAFLVALPLLLTVQGARLVRTGMPLSRVLNPGVLVVLVLATAAVAAAVLPAGRRVMVAGGPGWVARRTVVGGRWRVVHLADVATYSVRRHRARWTNYVVVAMAERSGRRTSLSLPAAHPGAAALAGALAAAGAQQSDRELRTMSGRRIAALTVAILAIGLLPMVLLEIGPFRLLPAGIAGEFSSSGCRAALAAERQSGAANRPVALTAAEPVRAAVWHLRGDWVQSAGEYAGGTSDPRARSRELAADGGVSFHHVEYAGPTGAVLVVQTVRFSTASGAAAYDRYVNRAVCERFDGSAGPAPTEVRMTSGRYELVRWVGGSTIYEVSPAMVSPRATAADVEGLAATLLAGGGGTAA